MAILQQLISPMTLKEFSEKHLFRAPFASPFQASQFKDLISWPLLWEIFQTEHKDCWLPKHGQLPPDPALQTGKLTFDQARKGYEEGRTVLVRHAEKAHPVLAEIAADFHQIFLDPVDIQIYGTPPEEEGFDWHYDSEEVFVIQSHGEKEFRLRKNTVNPWPQHMRIPKNMEFEREKPTAEIRCHLKAGDWLYIPSGWWHKARAITHSFHMSVGVMALTPAGFFEAKFPHLVESPLWRQRFPVRGGDGSLLSKEEIKQNLESFIAPFNEQLPSPLLQAEELMKFTSQIPKSK